MKSTGKITVPESMMALLRKELRDREAAHEREVEAIRNRSREAVAARRRGKTLAA